MQMMRSRRERGGEDENESPIAVIRVDSVDSLNVRLIGSESAHEQSILYRVTNYEMQRIALYLTVLQYEHW